MYPLLSMLADEGVVELAESEEARKPYRLTKEGAEELAENAEKVERLGERMEWHSEDQQQKAAPDVMRAFGNLIQVMSDKFRHSRIDVSSREELVDLIDDLAKRIERL